MLSGMLPSGGHGRIAEPGPDRAASYSSKSPSGARPGGAWPSSAWPSGAWPSGVWPSGAWPSGAWPSGSRGSACLPQRNRPGNGQHRCHGRRCHHQQLRRRELMSKATTTVVVNEASSSDAARRLTCTSSEGWQDHGEEVWGMLLSHYFKHLEHPASVRHPFVPVNGVMPVGPPSWAKDGAENGYRWC